MNIHLFPIYLHMIYSRAKFDLYRIYKTGTPRTAIQFQGLLEVPMAEKLGYSPSLPPLHLFHVIGGLAIDMQISLQLFRFTGDHNLTSPPPHPAFAKYMLIGQELGVRLANQLSFTGNVCPIFLRL